MLAGHFRPLTRLGSAPLFDINRQILVPGAVLVQHVDVVVLGAPVCCTRIMDQLLVDLSIMRTGADVSIIAVRSDMTFLASSIMVCPFNCSSPCRLDWCSPMQPQAPPTPH